MRSSTNLTLDQFLADPNARNAYVRERGFADLYVRKGPRYYGTTKIAIVLDIARIAAKRPGKGAFSTLLAKLQTIHPTMPIYVESVLNDRFAAWLERNGFERDKSGTPSFWLLRNGA
jgi:hypothetical protein